LSAAARLRAPPIVDDPSFPALVYARPIEGGDDTHDLVWPRSKPQAV
jgi:uncharacterized protein (DUF736 family)